MVVKNRGWWESPSGEDFHGWRLSLLMKVIGCWHSLGGKYHRMMVMVDGYHQWVSPSNDGHWLLAAMVGEYYWVMVVTSFWWAPSGSDHWWEGPSDENHGWRLSPDGYHLLMVTIIVSFIMEWHSSSDNYYLRKLPDSYQPLIETIDNYHWTISIIVGDYHSWQVS